LENVLAATFFATNSRYGQKRSPYVFYRYPRNLCEEQPDILRPPGFHF